MMDRLAHYSAYEFIPYPGSRPASTCPSPDSSSLEVKHTSTWTYCGPLLTPSSLPSSLHTWSITAISPPSELLRRLLPLLAFLHTLLSTAGVQHYWLTLRATRPTTEYNIPRWHVDDDFFTPISRISPQALETKGHTQSKRKGEGAWKLCTTLLGPPTLFLPLARNARALSTLRCVKQKEAAKRPHSCCSTRCAGCFDTGAAVRNLLATAFSDEETVQTKQGEVAVFRTGEEGAVHSEPRCDVDRVFVNIVPGTEEELRVLMGRFGMMFPRAWSLGVPVCADDGLYGFGGT